MIGSLTTLRWREINMRIIVGYASDFVSHVINDSNISGAVFPRVVISCRIIDSSLKTVKNFGFKLRYQQGKDGCGVVLAQNITRYKNVLNNILRLNFQNVRDRIMGLMNEILLYEKCMTNWNNINILIIITHIT